MADLKLPRQIALVLSLFPQEGWAGALVNALNQFSLEVVQAFRFAVPQYKTLTFSTGATVADSFPIDFPVDAFPSDVWIAGVPSGDQAGTSAITVKWLPVVANSLVVRVSLITGLSANSTYAIRLGFR